ncbi:MAG TPA: ABC transporter permease [Kofleriaceae bacterium]
MTAWRQTLEVARWELRRFFKWRDVVLSLVIVAIVSVTTWAVSAWQSSSRDTVRIAVISELELGSIPGFELESRPAGDEAALRAEVERGDRDGLVIASAERMRVIVRKEPMWLGAVRTAVTSAVQVKRLEQLGVTPEAVAGALAPVPTAIELTSGTHRGSAKFAAVVLIVLMLIFLFAGTGYLFMSITGEKQQRATEQLFTMATPQVLMDGKLLGASALATLSVIQMLAITLVTWHSFSSNSLASVLGALAGIGAIDLVVLLGFALAGAAFWMATTAGLFATIDDPNSSARSSVMMLPALPLSVAFIGLGSPDSSMMQILSYVPITATTVIPARLVLGEVAPVTIAVSFAVLLVSTWFLRRIAARIYQAGMLMYGKEPGFGEMLRWLRRAR